VERVSETHVTDICVFDDDACWIKECVFVIWIFK